MLEETNSLDRAHLKLDEKAMIKNRYKWIPHPAPDIKWESTNKSDNHQPVTVMILSFQTPQKCVVITLKFELCGFTIE